MNVDTHASGTAQSRPDPTPEHPFVVHGFTSAVADLLGPDWSAESRRWGAVGILTGPYTNHFTFKVDWEEDLCAECVRLPDWPTDPVLPNGFHAYHFETKERDGVFLKGAAPGDNPRYLAEQYAAAVRAITGYRRVLADEFGREVVAADAATQALAARGITAHAVVDGDESWLIVGRNEHTGAHALLHLYRGAQDTYDVHQVPDLDHDNWYAATVGTDGLKLLLAEQPAEELETCVEAIAEWLDAGQPARNVPAEIADLHGRFADGYTPEGIRDAFARIHEAGGPFLVCVWDYADDAGFGGSSQFYAETGNGELFEVEPDVHLWLSGQMELPAPMCNWVRGPAGPADFPVTDDFHNYARAEHTG
ncbi:hypothetical protein ACIF6K_28355 [Streptomyces sp. NPDC085942]|uniref:hypothetical protein n=1 Tax=Streptomyces sp. NPDC085942 TaxID=3365743 RepID=UPI0037CDB9CF